MLRAADNDEKPTNGPAPAAPYPPHFTIAPSTGADTAARSVPLDGYQFIARLGAGGMGSVWRAIHTSTRREVALKLLISNGPGSENAKKRFEREVEVAGRLVHPNIAHVFESGVHEGAYFYTMELIEGSALDQFVHEHQLNMTGILKLMSTICRAIQYAHQRGVIHRDLKPSNILVDDRGNPHIVDFGLGKLSHTNDPAENLTFVGQLAGTPAFMSPEQAAGRSDDVDTRTDVYSLGVILYLLATGQLPHSPTGDHLAVIHRVINDEIIRPRTISPKIDRELEAIILKALAKRPEDRYSSAETLADDIENYIRGDPLSARRANSIYFLRKKMAKHWLTLNVIALGLGGFVALWVSASLRIAQQRDVAIAADARSKALLQESSTRLAKSLISFGDLRQKEGNWRDAKAHYLDADRIGLTDNGIMTNLALAFLENERFAPTTISKYFTYFNATSSISGIFFEPDERIVRLQFGGGILDTFDLARGCTTGTAGLQFQHDQVMETVASPNGDAIYRLIQNFDGSAPSHRIERIDPHTKQIYAKELSRPFDPFPIAIATNGKRTIAALIDHSAHVKGQVDLWITPFASNEQPISTSIPERAQLVAMSISPDLQSVAVGDIEGRLAVYKPTADAMNATAITEMRVNETPGFGGVQCLKYSPDGMGILVGDISGDIGFASLRSPAQFRRIGACDGRIQVLAFSSDARFAMTGDEAGVVKLWDIAANCEYRDFYADFPIVTIQMSPDDKLLAAASRDGTISLWPVYLDDQTLLLKCAAPAEQVALSGDGLLIAIAIRDQVQVYDVATQKLLRQLTADGNVTTFAFSANASHLRIGTDLGNLTEYNTFEDAGAGKGVAPGGPSSETRLYSPNAAKGLHHAIYISADGTAAIDLTDNCATRIDLSSMHQVNITRDLPGAIAGISSDGMKVIAIPRLNSPKRTVSYYDFSSQTVRAIPVDQDSVQISAAISADGKIAFLGSNDGAIQAIDLAYGQPIWASASHQHIVRCLKLSPDGQLLLSAGNDGSVKLWDIQTGAYLRTVAEGLTSISTIAFSPRGDLIVCNGAQGNGVCVWDLRRAGEFQNAARRADQARSALLEDSSNASAAQILVDWYAQKGLLNWDQGLLDELKLDGRIGLVAARCRLRLNDNTQAAKDFKPLIGQSGNEISDEYLRACYNAATSHPD